MDGRPADVPVLRPDRVAVDLIWLPLGAGGRSVRLNGKVYEAITSALKGRRRHDLYHSALEVFLADGRYIIESAPVPNARGSERGVVAAGPVGARWAGRWRIFRYEIRCWRDGVIPDRDEAMESPQTLTTCETTARRLLRLAPRVPTPVWGRDESRAGEMWNSNSVVSWLLVMSGADVGSAALPEGGRAPGWDAGIVVARRSLSSGAAPLA